MRAVSTFALAAPLAIVAAMAGPLTAPLAMAQSVPPSFPTRDVAVSYRSANGTDLQMAWLVSERKVRIDIPGGAGAVVMDMRSGKNMMLMEDQRMASEVTADGVPPQVVQLPEGATYTREGTETVAGLTCTVWSTEFQNTRSRACVTNDGVLLRARAEGETDGLEAVKVTYAPQDPGRFRVPRDFLIVPGGR